MPEERLVLGGESEEVLAEAVQKRFLSIAVSGAEKLILMLVIEGEGKHAI